MKAEKGSEIITTICEYENSVAMPDNECLTYLDTCGIARLKDGNGNVKAQEAYANRCSEYLRFGHEVDLAACGAYSPYDALKVCDTPEIFLKTGFEQRPMLYTQKHLFQALTPKSDYNPHRHGFSIEQVKRFPELLASPVVLANSPTRDDVLLAILLATDAYDPAHRGHQAGRHGKLRGARSGDEYGLERLQQTELHPLLRSVTGYGCLRVRKRQENRSARRPIRASACRKLLRSRY